MLTPLRLKSPYVLDLAQSLSNVELLFPVSVSFFFRWDHWMFVLSFGFLFYTLLWDSKYPRRVVVALQNSCFIVIELIIYTVSCTQKTHRQTARCWCRKKNQYTKTSRGVSSLNLFGFDFVTLFTIICLLCCKLNNEIF